MMDGDFPSHPPFSAPRGKSFPEILREVQAANYLVTAIATAWYYDLIITIPEDVSLFHGRRFTIPDLTYTASKVLTLTWTTLAVAFIAMPASNLDCHIVLQATAWLVAVATPLNAFLFLIRVVGIFRGNRAMVYIFCGLWLSTWSSFVIPVSFNVNENPRNAICLATETKPYGAAGFCVVLLFDTAVFVAISLKVTSFGMNHSWRERFRIFFTGQETGYISRTLLRSGQLYYLSVIGLHVVIVIALVDNTTPTTVPRSAHCRYSRSSQLDGMQSVPTAEVRLDRYRLFSFIGSEEYDHNVMPDFAVREDSNDASVIYLHTVPRNGGSEDLHSPMEFYTDRHK
ncbi:hypothetical protein QCA50_005112 [Cerrena zonata]|uniref:Uncharacterized protein n=1 Tax=Cerrena zonata TaxID=2478898 RepID=A0AAW0GIQ8_9APHY